MLLRFCWFSIHDSVVKVPIPQTTKNRLRLATGYSRHLQNTFTAFSTSVSRLLPPVGML
jgi:hypothetical protein